MDFKTKVKFLRKLSKFMVAQEIEVKAVAYSTREVSKPENNDFVLASTEKGYLILKKADIEKIIREYPDLEEKLT